MSEDGMVREHHQLNGHELEQLWEISGRQEPSLMQSMGLQRVGQDIATRQHRQYLNHNLKKVTCTELLSINSILLTIIYYERKTASSQKIINVF